MEASQASDEGSIPSTRSIVLCNHHSIILVKSFMIRFRLCGLVLLIAFAGCAPYTGAPGSHLGLASSGSTHRVARGETLWAIAKHYGVKLEDLVQANQIPDASRIEVGQRLLIPSDRRPVSTVQADTGSQSWEGREISFSGLAGSDSEGFSWPVEGKVISSFGMRRWGVVNKGIDIRAPLGADVFAARDGVVSFIHENLPGFGKTVILEHGDDFATVYSYLNQILVRPGDRVNRRQMIARVGSTGRAEVPALHFEIRRSQKPQNPFYYLP